MRNTCVILLLGQREHYTHGGWAGGEYGNCEYTVMPRLLGSDETPITVLVFSEFEDGRPHRPSPGRSI
jgi:hypothetical protein